MEQMAAFKTERTSDEDKLAWVGDYKRGMETQDQLPLLFQTMTAANFMNVKLLLDELCKFVAEMIAKRTPNEILEYFNIKKDATWEEEQELIATHKWIDPEGLIAKYREKILAEKESMVARRAAFLDEVYAEDEPESQQAERSTVRKAGGTGPRPRPRPRQRPRLHPRRRRG